MESLRDLRINGIDTGQIKNDMMRALRLTVHTKPILKFGRSLTVDGADDGQKKHAGGDGKDRARELTNSSVTSLEGSNLHYSILVRTSELSVCTSQLLRNVLGCCSGFLSRCYLRGKGLVRRVELFLAFT
jgi:hypothetical protein